jgi:hypothetical protein
MFTLALIAICLTGCRPTCEGSDCAARYPAADLALLRGGPWGGARDAESPDARISGRDDEGHDHALRTDGAGFLTGIPSVGEVRRWDALAFELGAAAVVALGDPAARFGAAVDGDTALLLVGAPDTSAGAGLDAAGAVYGFTRPAVVDGAVVDPLTVPDFTVLGSVGGARFGEGVVRCADLDGDGAADWVATAPGADVDARLAGAVFVAASSDTLSGDLQSDALRRLAGATAGEAFGTSVACTSDLTGDGIADLVVGAPWAADAGASGNAGAVYLFAGGPDIGRAAAAFTLTGESAGEALGAAVLTADLDADGAPELVAGAPARVVSSGADGRGGAVWVWSGTSLRAGTAARSTLLRTPYVDSALGTALSAADVDGDGALDLLVGAPGTNPAGDDVSAEAGAVHLFFGPSTTWPALATPDDAQTAVGAERQYLRTGERLAATDLDGDEAADLLLLTRAEADGAG